MMRKKKKTTRRRRPTPVTPYDPVVDVRLAWVRAATAALGGITAGSQLSIVDAVRLAWDHADAFIEEGERRLHAMHAAEPPADTGPPA